MKKDGIFLHINSISVPALLFKQRVAFSQSHSYFPGFKVRAASSPPGCSGSGRFFGLSVPILVAKKKVPALLRIHSGHSSASPCQPCSLAIQITGYQQLSGLVLEIKPIRVLGWADPSSLISPWTDQ